MILLITGCSHTGKTLLAQRLLETYHYPYLSIDHLKMGLIRSGQTALTPQDDALLTQYLWPILREMIKTAIENEQNLTIEGCYIPFTWQEDFSEEYLAHIRYLCLVMSENYIRRNFSKILRYGNVIEQRLENSLSMEELILENAQNLALCRKHQCPYLLMEEEYRVDWDPFI